MQSADIIALLQPAFPDAALEAAPAVDQPTMYVPADRLPAIARDLRDRPEVSFAILADLTAVDWWPREPRFELIYHFSSPRHRFRLRVKTRVPGDDPHVPTLSDVWPAAAWLEREVWDLFGIFFDGHTDLRRLLMPDDWEGHPLRKDYPVQIKMTPKSFSPLQITEAEFRESLQADRAVRKRD
jgi:NADH-quinone oxidoreductase subunit C